MQPDNRKPLAMTMGDPAGVGPQIACKAWLSNNLWPSPFYAVAPPKVMQQAAIDCGLDMQIIEIEDHKELDDAFRHGLPVFPIDGPLIHSGHPSSGAAQSVVDSIETAVDHARSGLAGSIVTNPINKALLYGAGFEFPGHTEFLAHLAKDESGKSPLPVMMLVGSGLRIALATIHVPLRQVPDLITEETLGEIGRIVHYDLVSRFGIEAPKIALAGLNPHAGEDGEIGDEELRIINPTADKLRSEGINISDAISGDIVFSLQRDGHYDAVIAMYHDQGLAPIKTLDMWSGVNVTLGLPFIRTSPDHGTAYEVAKNGNARPDSLIAALELAQSLSAPAVDTKSCNT